ncbi:hypothetical protein BV25DRAFT_1899548 [Artomyces pyxidatus]|uniref:Uncharacterized protein n=1 Tax=Artomyces pyxidatus TaxID=48021 RepID=A0ACB8T3D6_9AGAM|nr:hypothetical protein BV25DRAFT_1899548 [Artomyces pyxidatus]
MSARKRKSPSSDSQTYEAIQGDWKRLLMTGDSAPERPIDLLVKIKANLNNSPESAETSLVTDLYELSALAERFTLQRSSSTPESVEQGDILDREGTNLWNISSTLRPAPDDQITTSVAALRLSGFRLIEAGLPPKPSIENLIHMLQLASKTGTTLAEIGKHEVASSVLGSAAKYEQSLRGANDPQGIYQQSKVQATVVYYCSRMEAAWKQGNETLAEFMLQNITESENERLVFLPARDRELLASKLLEIGRSLLTGATRGTENDDDTRAKEAVKWIQKAFTLAEQLDDNVTAGAAELKRCILRNLTRAYVLSSAQDPENLSRAETSLNELLASIETFPDHEESEYQELRWWKLAVLKRRNATNDALLEAFRSIIDHMEFTEDNVTNVLYDLRTLAHQQLVVTVLQHCLRTCLDSDNGTGLPFIDRLLLALIFQCSKDVDHSRAMRDLRDTLSFFQPAEFELPKVCATACLMLFWQYGERRLSSKRFSEAADWFLLGTHQAFACTANTCNGKCYRKAALCHIEQQEYAQAATIIRRCPGDEAPTHYVMLLVAVKQGMEADAIRAVKAMVQASHFDRKMLLMATRLAHESDLKNLLLFVLQELLKLVRNRESIEADVEPITLVRCMIRIVLRLLADPANDKNALIDALIGHFSTAKALVLSAYEDKRASMVMKDISWLWRTAYNCAAQGCTEWENAEVRVPALFEVSRELLETYFDTAFEVDEEMYLCIVFASFAATSARVFSMRKMSADKTELVQSTAQEIKACEDRLRNILDKAPLQPDNVTRVQHCLRVLIVFEAEVACRMKEWGALPQIIEKAARIPTPLVDTFEAITDMLWADRDCPIDVLFAAIEAILHASLERSSLSVEKFSRWLRAICTMLLSRNTAPDRLKAIGYIEQAISVLEEHGGDQDGEEEVTHLPHRGRTTNALVNVKVYPMDERYWLLTSSYNTGIECLHVCLLDEAKRWFESSTVLCRYVSDGEGRAQKIAETYTQLLNRYAS